MYLLNLYNFKKVISTLFERVLIFLLTFKISGIKIPLDKLREAALAVDA